MCAWFKIALTAGNRSWEERKGLRSTSLIEVPHCVDSIWGPSKKSSASLKLYSSIFSPVYLFPFLLLVWIVKSRRIIEIFTIWRDFGWKNWNISRSHTVDLVQIQLFHILYFLVFVYLHIFFLTLIRISIETIWF